MTEPNNTSANVEVKKGKYMYKNIKALPYYNNRGVPVLRLQPSGGVLNMLPECSLRLNINDYRIIVENQEGISYSMEVSDFIKRLHTLDQSAYAIKKTSKIGDMEVIVEYKEAENYFKDTE